MSISEVRTVWKKHWQKDPNFLPIDPNHDSISVILTTLLANLPNSHATFLDVGSGPGSRTISILGQRKNTKIILLDQSSKALELGKQHALDKQTLTTNIAADCFKLPFLDDSLDCVFSNGVNEHFLDPSRQNLFNEMARIVKPSGHLAVITPNRLNVFHTLNKTIQERNGTWPHGPQYDFSPNELIKKMKETGLTDVNLFGVGAFTSWIRLFPREKQDKYYQSPTSLKLLNHLLWKLDGNTNSGVNKLLGREILVMGKKPVKNQVLT